MTNFEFDDFDSQVNCEEFFSGPTDTELQEMMAQGEWEAVPMFPYDYDGDGFDVLELETIFRGLGFDVITFE